MVPTKILLQINKNEASSSILNYLVSIKIQTQDLDYKNNSALSGYQGSEENQNSFVIH